MKEVAKEFKQFIMRGNVIDMAVGIIIGAAFTKIVNSMVADILMPPLGLLMGKVDFSNWFVVLKPGADGVRTFTTMADAQAAGATTLNLGLFLNAIISFVIVAFILWKILIVSLSAAAVRKMTLLSRRLGSLRIAARVCRPSMPGMAMSSRMRSTGFCRRR